MQRCHARLETEPDEALEERRDAARQIIEIARRVAKGDESSGKGESGAQRAPLPSSLSRFVQPGSADEAKLQSISPAVLDAIAEGVDHLGAGRRHLNIVQREVLDDIRAKVAACPDYKGEVAPVVDEVLLLILNFVAAARPRTLLTTLTCSTSLLSGPSP